MLDLSDQPVRCRLAHPDASVLGISDGELGDVVHAVIQPRPLQPADEMFEKELLEYFRQRLTRFTCPRRVDPKDDLPPTPTGKMLRRVLREQHRNAKVK